MIKMYALKLKSGVLAASPENGYPILCPIDPTALMAFKRIQEALIKEIPTVFTGCKIITLKEAR